MTTSGTLFSPSNVTDLGVYTTASCSTGALLPYSVGNGGTFDPPVITVVSPTPGVAPGMPGGFPLDPVAAAATEIVLQVTDINPGLALVVVSASFLGNTIAETVYRRGAFRGVYAASSYALPIAAGLELHCRRTGGWPAGTSTIGDIEFDVDAIDLIGGLTP